jgi:hypothetical protein
MAEVVVAVIMAEVVGKFLIINKKCLKNRKETDFFYAKKTQIKNIIFLASHFLRRLFFKIITLVVASI